MKTRSITLSLACLTLTALLAASALSQDKDYKAGQKAPAQEMNPEMQAWMKAGTPNENHHRLNYAVGKWNCTIKMWEPGAEKPSVSKGTDVTKWILQNHYVATEFNGEFMGMPFAGHGIGGYDNINQRYFNIWFDTMSTGPSTETGAFDESTKTFFLAGEFNSPMGSKMYSRTVIKIVSDDKHVLTMYHGEDADKLDKVMEITYDRDRSAAAPTGKHRVVTIEKADDKKLAAKLPGCCQAAADAGKACAHACCVEAAKAGKVCPKCSKG
ncbi:MAG: DUF1579 domain-containing protein [Planctomycetes bacterium]|nr:DUF1579 domain-containing protein [Planctomycetota bacterium]